MEENYRSNKSVEVNSDIINRMPGRLYRLAINAYESKNDSAAEEIFLFIEKKISEALDRNNIAVFNQLIKVPIWIYENSITHNSSYYNRSFEHVSKFYKRLFSNRLIIVKSMFFGSKRDFNDYIYYGYVSFLYLFYRMTFYKKFEDLNTVLIEFKRVLIDRERVDFRTKSKIRELLKEKSFIEAKELVDSANVDYYANLLYRHSLLSMLSWLWFYYSLNEISKDEILELTNTLGLSYDYGDDLINDAIYVRENSHWEYLEINDFDNEVRREMEAFSPPQVHNWITFGLTVMLLRSSDITNIDISLIKNDITASMLIGPIEHNLLVIENEIEKWRELIGIQDVGEFPEKKRSIINLFSQLKRRYQAFEYQKHSVLQISDKKVHEFQIKSAKTWAQSSKLKRLFKQYNLLIENNNSDVKYAIVSHRILFQKAKTMFTDENYQGIIGSEDFAAQFGRNRFDNFIFNDIINKKNATEINSINTFLDNSIETIKLRGVDPNVIIMAPEFLKIAEFTENPLLKQRWQIPENVSNDLIGMYDNIPIYHTFSSMMKDKIIICQFENSFALEVYNDDSIIPPDLRIKIEEFDQNKAEIEFEKDPGKWVVDREGNTLTKEEALNIIKSSVIINFEAKYLLTIKNENFYEIGKIDQKYLD